MVAGSLVRVLGAATIAAAATLSLAVPAAAARADVPDIAFTLAFDKAEYAPGDSFSLTFTFTNNGPVAADKVHVSGGDDGGVVLNGAVPQDFDLAAGATRTDVLTGTFNDSAVNTGHAHFGLGYEADNGDANLDDNISIARTFVVGATGSATGVVFDAAGGRPPAHSGVGCVTIALVSDRTGEETARTTTGADGTFAFTGLPAGDYLIDITMPTGYELKDPAGMTQVRRDEVASLYIEAVRSDDPVGPCPPPPPATTPATPGLAVTGDPTVRIAGIGLAVLLVGTALVLLARRRRATQAQVD